MIQYLSAVNDYAERALGLVSEFHTNKITIDSQQKQCLYQVVKSLQLQQTKLKGNLFRLIKQGCLVQNIEVDWLLRRRLVLKLRLPYG